jgi:hypothetical protein
MNNAANADELVSNAQLQSTVNRSAFIQKQNFNKLLEAGIRSLKTNSKASKAFY